jgi:hypothetical protein
MDALKDLIQINLVDKDGITVGSTNYKIANGAKIIMLVKGYPQIHLSNYVNPQENMNSKVTATNTLSTAIGPVKYSGNARPTISVNVLLPISITTPTRAQYAAMTGITPLSYYLLYNIWRYAHRMYLKDMLDNTIADNVNADYPINILINRTDLLNQTVFSADGVPVVLTSVKPVGEVLFTHSDTKQEETYFEYNLEFMIDIYDT